MVEVLTIVSDVLKRDEDLVLARIISDRGSTPRSAGARMIILRSGEIIGTIGGGMLEATAIEKAADAFESKLSCICRIDMTAEDVAGECMICGGDVEVLCEYIHPADDVRLVFGGLVAEHQKLKRTVLCTEFDDNDGLKSVRRFLLHDDLHNGSSTSPDLSDDIREASRSMAGSAILDINGRKYLIDILDNMASLYIFGAGHVGREVSSLAANVGFRTIVFDDRVEFANAERFPPPAGVIVLDAFDGCFTDVKIDENSYIVIVTRGHTHDKTVLGQALRTDAGYIGMIGSKRKRDTIYNTLLAEGFTDDDIKRVYSPIGLAIDTDTPEEIAVSIVGELIDIRSKKRKWIQKKQQL